MKIEEMSKVFNDVFTVMSYYDELFTKKYLKKREYIVPKQDRKILKVMYDSFGLKKYFKFWEFFEMSRKLTLLNKENILQSGFRIIEVVEPELYEEAKK